MKRRFSKAAPERAIPRSITVEPPSGMEFAEAENVQPSGLVVIFGSWLVKLQLITVSLYRGFVEETMPEPLTTTKPVLPATPPWLLMLEANSLNVNPPTLQKAGMAVEVFRFQMEPVNVAEVPGVIVLNAPESSVTMGVIHAVTWVAVAADWVLNVTPPVKPMLPTIGTALVVWVKARTMATALANLSIFFICILG